MFPWCFCRISPWTFSLLIATRQWPCETWRLVLFVRPKFSYSGRAEATFGMPSTITPPAATTFAECRTTTRKGSVFGFKIAFLPCILSYLVLSCAILCYSIFSQVNLLHLPIPISVVPGVPYCNSGPQISAVCPGCNLRHYRANVCGTVLRLQGLYEIDAVDCPLDRPLDKTAVDEQWWTYMPNYIASSAMNHIGPRSFVTLRGS